MDKSSQSPDENPVPDVEECAPSTSKGEQHSEDGRLTVYPIHDQNGEVVFLAPPRSSHLNMSFDKTTAWHMALNLKEELLKAVERALSEDCDPEVRARLEERKAALLKLPQYSAAAVIPLSLFDPKVTYTGEAVAITRTNKWGWHLVAARDVLPGEILVYERPYVIQIRRNHRAQRCHECGSLAHAKIPCRECSGAVFCDLECRDKSLERGHRFECLLTDVLIEQNVSSTELCALRTALRARCETSSWSRLRYLVKAWNETEEDPFFYEPDSYAAFYNLRTNLVQWRPKDIDRINTLSTAFLFSLRKHTSFFEDIRNEEDFWFFGGLLHHHVKVCVANAYDIRVLAPDVEGNRSKAELVGSNVSLLLSRLNHSSEPNVLQMMQNGMTALIALHPLQKGQQLFNGYGSHYETKERH